MRRVDDFRQNARACRELAEKMDGGVREHLLSMAKEWDQFAEERERQLKADGAGGDQQHLGDSTP